MNTLKTHYSHLQVVEDASPEVIKAAYKYLSQKYHPDRNPNDRVRCESIMQVLNEAYRILIDPELRKEYDEWIARQRRAERESVKEENKTVHTSDSWQGKEQAPKTPEVAVKERSELVYCRSCGATISKYAKACPSCGRPQGTPKSKTTAGILAILFGGFGLHRFYLGQWWGIFYLLLFWAAVPAIIALVEGIVFLFMSNEKWEKKYGNTSGNWGFMFVVVILGIMGLGVLAAIVVPLFDHLAKTSTTEGAVLAESLKEKVEEYAVEHQVWPSHINDIGGQRALTSSNIGEYGVMEGGVIYVVFSETSGISGKVLGYVPSVNEEGYIVWTCDAADLESKYHPANCLE